MKRLLILGVLGLAAAPAIVASQSLADIARREEARRKAITEPSKVYTNESLRPDSAKGTPPPSNATPATPEPSTQVPEVVLPGGKVDPATVKDQAYWSGRMTAARAALDRSRIFADALQSRINALSTDFVNRDDPAQRAQIELERQRAVSELDRVKREIADQTKAIADLEEEARKAGVPPGWLR